MDSGASGVRLASGAGAWCRRRYVWPRLGAQVARLGRLLLVWLVDSWRAGARRIGPRVGLGAGGVGPVAWSWRNGGAWPAPRVRWLACRCVAVCWRCCLLLDAPLVVGRPLVACVARGLLRVLRPPVWLRIRATAQRAPTYSLPPISPVGSVQWQR